MGDVVAIILLQNGDDQGLNARGHFTRIAPNIKIINVGFDGGGRVLPQTFQEARQWAATELGQNIVVWAGHGRGPETHVQVGRPMSSANNVMANEEDVLSLIAVLNPKKIYFATCRAMRWVERQRRLFERTFTYVNSAIAIYAPTPKIPGFTFMAIAKHLVHNAPAPASFNQPLFSTTEVFGETFFQWRDRVDSRWNTSPGGAREAPF
jgi:hypothetical protein